MKVNPAEVAAKVRALAREYNARIEVRGTVVSATIRFTPGDARAYACAESDVSSIIYAIPAKGGSIWGTDGASVGGYVGLKGGYMTLNVSGVGARVAAALAKGG